MRRMLTAVALTIAVSTAAYSTAYADCKDEVSSALERQRKTSGFRMDTTMITEDGKVDMTVDYALPDRMRQVVKSTKDPDPVETVVVGKYAWSHQQGQPWVPLNPKLTESLVSQMEETLGDNPDPIGDFACLGKRSLDGKEMLAYEGENEDPNKKDDPNAKNKPKLPDRPVRVIYVDATTGLPMRSIFAHANDLDKPIFESNFSYPIDIAIEVPKLSPAPPPGTVTNSK
jgi:outer membrane lipoprotein-sorting protein